MENDCIYLLSSNASKKYILDVLETLSLPFGVVQHFRYQLRWLDDDLKSRLPKKGENKKNELQNIKVLINYLYQEKTQNQWEWVAIYPIRTGILLDAYKTGDEGEDVAHFYFRAENYISYNDKDFVQVIKDKLGGKYGESSEKHWFFREISF